MNTQEEMNSDFLYVLPIMSKQEAPIQYFRTKYLTLEKALNALSLLCVLYMIHTRILVDAYPAKYYRNLCSMQTYLKPF